MVKEKTERDRATDHGIVRISNDAITTIASIAAMEVLGVTKMGGGLGKTLLGFVFKKVSSRGVRISAKDSDMKLVVSIIVDYGVDIPRVADEVQENVKRAVEKMAGFALSEVDVVIEGVRGQNPVREEKNK